MLMSIFCVLVYKKLIDRVVRAVHFSARRQKCWCMRMQFTHISDTKINLSKFFRNKKVRNGSFSLEKYYQTYTYVNFYDFVGKWIVTRYLIIRRNPTKMHNEQTNEASKMKAWRIKYPFGNVKLELWFQFHSHTIAYWP